MVSHLKQLIRRISLYGDSDRKLLRAVSAFTLNPPESLRTLKRLATIVNQSGIPGDFVECGTYKGGSAAVMGTALNANRHLWLYDSFEGMPNAGLVDGEEAKKWEGKCIASEDDVRAVMATVAISRDCYTIRSGWFQDTFLLPLPRQVAFLHCDADWHDAVILVLKTFYPLVPKGGCVLLDDFGYWEGCREAFYDFCTEYGEKPLLERQGQSQAYWIKGKMENRQTT